MKEKLLSISLSVILALFLLSVSIAIHILIRETYYVQIERLSLPEQTGYSEETIREAYDDVLDYCTLGGERAGQTFRTGSLAWSESGKSHFDDVERLFHLDFVIAAVTGGMLVIFLISHLVLKLRNRHTGGQHATGPGGLKICRFRKRGPLYWGPAFLLGLLAILGILAAIDFDAFFTGFHHLFFPGKENWVFDYNTDEIIRILPEEVFQYFGLAILGILAAG